MNKIYIDSSSFDTVIQKAFHVAVLVVASFKKASFLLQMITKVPLCKAWGSENPSLFNPVLMLQSLFYRLYKDDGSLQ